MKLALQAFAIAVTIIAATQGNRIEAQESVSGPISAFEDSFYDFEVYAAQEPGTGFFMVWDMPGGETITYGPYYTFENAQNHLMRILFGGWEPAGYEDVEIVERPLEPEFILFETVGTRAAANELAAQLESFGLLTQIKRVSTLKFQNLTLQKVTTSAITTK